ncbi:hypothetical protein AVEN_259213-1 [Araneus ventricosus]|uniref:Uncharacterized protein n=1 Tax=Araneus ventricosus TaxID=182803 RepID=A0A4Y2QQ44_ARAVE|nr:hypothetical protein AVEN_259213-1 [Araneus ventricosus]
MNIIRELLSSKVHYLLDTSAKPLFPCKGKQTENGQGEVNINFCDCSCNDESDGAGFQMSVLSFRWSTGDSNLVVNWGKTSKSMSKLGMVVIV